MLRALAAALHSLLHDPPPTAGDAATQPSPDLVATQGVGAPPQAPHRTRTVPLSAQLGANPFADAATAEGAAGGAADEGDEGGEGRGVGVW